MTMIKSTLGLPLYYMFLFRAPVKVIRQMEKIKTNFFSGRNEEGRKLNKVAWYTVCMSKAK